MDSVRGLAVGRGLRTHEILITTTTMQEVLAPGGLFAEITLGSNKKNRC
jgi:hypothetical protein